VQDAEFPHLGPAAPKSAIHQIRHQRRISFMEMVRNTRAVRVGVALVLTFAPLSWACDFAYSPSPVLYQRASAIFVGKVVESPWSRGKDGSTTAAPGKSLRVRFSVERKLRGSIGAEVRLSSQLTDCSYPFIEGETYLVHASLRNGQWDSGSPDRPLLLSDAGEALKYIEGALRNRAPGLLFGYPLLRDRDGKTTSPPVGAALSVHLEGKSGRFTAQINREQYFEIAAPPGDYSAWLDLNGKPISERKNVRLVQGKAILQSLEGKLNASTSSQPQ
jgi:hypothetical protein